MSFLGGFLRSKKKTAKKRHNTGRPEATDDGDKLRNCSIEEKGYEEFVLCRNELDDPRKCLNEGKAVTGCTLEFFRKVKGTCFKEFTQYANCLDKSSIDLAYKHCRKTQAVFDKCMKDNLNLERPSFGYFCQPKVHDSKRPKPEPKKPEVYADYTPYLPDDYPRTPAKYGARFHWME